MLSKWQSIDCSMQHIDDNQLSADQAVEFRRAGTAPAFSSQFDISTDASTALSSSSSSDDEYAQFNRPRESNGVLARSRNPLAHRPLSQSPPSEVRKGEAVFGVHASPRNADEPSQLSSHSTQPNTLHCFVNYVMGTEPFTTERVATENEDVNDAYGIAPKRRDVYNFVQVPMRLERLLALGVAICVDEFLYLFTLLPFRCVLAVLQAIVARLQCSLKSIFVVVDGSEKSRAANRARCGSHQWRISTVIDFLHAGIFVFSSIVLAMFDISSVYHSIRGQSVIKLYVVFNVLEIFDRLCCSFGVDILDSLGWTTANAVNYFNAKLQDSAERSSTSMRESCTKTFIFRRSFRGFVLVTRVVVDYLFTLVYVSIHASLLLIWVVTLNVAINTQNNALLTLLVSNNFMELKGSVFKNFKTQNVFQVACSDAVERFQLTIFLGVMLVYAEGDRRLLLTWLAIFLSEIIVDWIKHAFVTKFNRISPNAYQQFSAVICRDIVQVRKNAAIRSIGGSGVAKRIGFVSLPLGALVVRMAAARVLQSPIVFSVLVFAIMAMLKLIVSIALLGHAVRTVKPTISEHQSALVEPQTSDEQATIMSLAKLGRYDKY